MQLWMRSLGMAPKPAAKAAGAAAQAAAVSKPTAQPPSSNPGEQVAGEQHTAAQGPADTAAAGGGSAQGSAEAAPASAGSSGSSSKAALAAAALAAAKELSAKGVASSYNKVTITETRKFAGKDIQVQLQVDKESKAAKAAAERLKVAASGLDAFLQDIEKKKKVGRGQQDMRSVAAHGRHCAAECHRKAACCQWMPSHLDICVSTVIATVAPLEALETILVPCRPSTPTVLPATCCVICCVACYMSALPPALLVIRAPATQHTLPVDHLPLPVVPRCR